MRCVGLAERNVFNFKLCVYQQNIVIIFNKVHILEKSKWTISIQLKVLNDFNACEMTAVTNGSCLLKQGSWRLWLLY